MTNEKAINEFRQSGTLKHYQDLIEQDKRALKQAEYEKFLKRQAEIQEIEVQISKLEFKLEILNQRLLVLKEAING